MAGEPFVYNGADWMPFDGNLGRLVFWKFHSSPPSGCAFVQSFVLDVSIPNLSWLSSFYGKIVSFVFNVSMRINLVISDTKEQLDHIGSFNNRIINYSFEESYMCLSATTWKTNSNSNPLPSLDGIHKPWTSATNMKSDPTYTINREIRAFGLSCKSGTTENPCKIVGDGSWQG